jgi:prepilin-type N-terminal cleavage/methylation domain-containing protein
MKGFTLLEFLVVIAIFLVVLAGSVPFVTGFYVTQKLEEAAADIMFTMRRAQSQSIAGLGDSQFGVRLESSEYILFQGSSYATRDSSQSEVFALPSGVVTTNFNEVVFSKTFGTSTQNASLTVSFNSLSKTIQLTTDGRIELK